MSNQQSDAFGQGHISLGIFLHLGDHRKMLQLMLSQASSALNVGFDGVTFPEHHGGRSSYPPDPLLITAQVLSREPRGWCAPAPTLPLLRSARVLAENLAWLDTSFEGRIGAALGAGFDKSDFDAVGAGFDDRMSRFRFSSLELSKLLWELPRLEDLIGVGEPTPIVKTPVLIATRGPQNAKFAGESGFGLFLPPLPPEVARSLVDVYSAAGGRGPVTVSSWVWLGAAPTESVDALNNAISSTQGDLSWRDDSSVIQVISSREPMEIVSKLANLTELSGGTNLHLRLHLPGISAQAINKQITLLGQEVLPALHAELLNIYKSKS